MRNAAGIGQDLLSDGYARFALDADASDALAAALRASRSFFALPAETKAQYSSADKNFGYRPLGLEYSITPDRPDLNECFTLWSERLDLIPRHEEIGDLTGGLVGWRRVLAPIVTALLTALADKFQATAPDFAAASYLQVNGYSLADSERDLLQDRHEDGHLLTVQHSTGPGLEIWPGDLGPTPLMTGHNEVLVMPGSVLSDLTGGAIAPLDHQVRNCNIANRTAIMYFVNPELVQPLYSWTADNGDARTDLRDRVRSRPSAFGLPDVPSL